MSLLCLNITHYSNHPHYSTAYRRPNSLRRSMRILPPISAPRHRRLLLRPFYPNSVPWSPFR